MRHLNMLAVLLATLLVSACGIFSQTPEEVQRTAQIVRERLDNRTYTIDVDYMIPLRGKPQIVNSFSITVDGDVLDAHLP